MKLLKWPEQVHDHLEWKKIVEKDRRHHSTLSHPIPHTSKK
jgi:hypothetical protein